MSTSSEQKLDQVQPAADTPRALTLTNLILAICFFMPVCSVFGIGKDGHASFWFYSVAVFSSLILGFVCAWIMWQSLNLIILSLSKRSPNLVNGTGFRGKCMSILLIVSMFAWCVITGFLADRMNSAIHHWIS